MDTIENMRAFLAVAETGSFTKAAQVLGQSTNMVSKRVAALEARLALRLFNRTTRHVGLTETGQSYADDCRRLIEDFDAVERTAMQAHTSPQGHLRIAAPISFGELFVSPATADFLAEFPDITADVSLEDRFVDIVAEGYDIAIRIGKLENSSVVAKRLASTDLYFCAAPAYLKKRGTPKHPEDITAHECIIDTNVRTGEQWLFGAGEGERLIKISGRLKVNGAAAVRAALLTGAGIALSPSYVVEEDIQKGDLVRLFADEPAQRVGIYAMYPHNRHLAAKVCSYVRHLQAYFRKQ